MALIFGDCPDAIGGCFRYLSSYQRQYFIFFLCLVISILASYSCFKTYRSQKKLTFQLLPLLINTLTTLVMLAFYIQMNAANADLYLLIVEFYSYFILCFGLVMIVIKQSQSMRVKISAMIKIFVIVSIISAITIVALIIVEFVTDAVGCRQEQGIGKIIILSIQIPLILITFYFILKFKKLLRASSVRRTEGVMNTFMTRHLIQQEDRYIILKKRQSNLIFGALLLNFILHIVEITLYYTDNQQLCNSSDQIQVKTSIHLIILWIQNIVQLFPHFAIPFIFWYLPARISSKFKSVYMSHNPSESFTREKQSLPKIKFNQDQSLYQNLHTEQNIRQKLIPRTTQNLQRQHSFSPVSSPEKQPSFASGLKPQTSM